MAKSDYRQQYLDPRWQKKRLEVLGRDEWRCQWCQDDNQTLHVHHLYYTPGKVVWDYPLDAFLTLCETCHAEEYENRPQEEKWLLEELKKRGFSASDLHDLMIAVHSFQATLPPEVSMSVIANNLRHNMPSMEKFYWDWIEKRMRPTVEPEPKVE